MKTRLGAKYSELFDDINEFIWEMKLWLIYWPTRTYNFLTGTILCAGCDARMDPVQLDTHKCSWLVAS